MDIMMHNSGIDNTTLSVYKSIAVTLQLLSYTKDSLHVKWDIDEDNSDNIAGYELQFQAQGSNVEQRTKRLAASQRSYDITQLHEDTLYKVCLQIFVDYKKPFHKQDCISASTSTDSLSVALGSTVGAFLALGIIILFVFIAKWQHTRKTKKHLGPSNNKVELYDSVGQNDLDSDTSMCVNDETIKPSEIGSDLSQTINPENILLSNGFIIAPSLANCSECSEPISMSIYNSSQECCQCNHDTCCNGSCSDIECHHRMSSHYKARRKSYQMRQKSTESRLSMLSHQYSFDSVGSSNMSKRGSLRRQRSQDSDRSQNNRSQHLFKQKSQDSAYLNQKYLAPTADGTFDEHYPYLMQHQHEPCSSNPCCQIQDNPSDNELSQTNDIELAQITYLDENSQLQKSSQSAANPFMNPDGRPPDVRPKVPTTLSLNNTDINS